MTQSLPVAYISFSIKATVLKLACKTPHNPGRLLPSYFLLLTLLLSYPSPKAPAKWLTHWSLRFLAVSIALRGVNSSKDHLFPVCSPPGNLPGFCEWKNVACHISKQRMLQPSRHYSCPQWWAWGNSGWKQTGCPPSSPQPLQPSLVVHPEGTQDGKEWDAGPR